MSRIQPVTLSEFLLLVEYAQVHHATKNEPIPQVYPSQYNGIKSCLEMPFQTFGGRLCYKGFYSKVSILFYLINKNHCLTNGNKRMACITMAFFCHKNNHELLLPPNDFYNMAKLITESDPIHMDRILKIIERMIRATEK